MKQLKVSKACNGCGACIFKSPYFEEEAEGNAVPVAGKAINPDDLEAVGKVAEECPQRAITIVEVKGAVKSGAQGLRELLKKLEDREHALKVPRVKASELKFSGKDCAIMVPFSSKEYLNNYSSEGQAKSAARSEFENLCYLPSAYRPVLKRIFVEYKVKKLRPYYTNENTEENFYYKFNQSVERFLREIYGLAREAAGGAFGLPESWCRFDVRLDEGSWEIKMLQNYDECSTSSEIIEEFKSRGEYTSLNWYVNQMDFDYDEMYAGEGMFGRSKFKNMWHFSGFSKAAEEYVNDLKSAIEAKSGDITDHACDLVNCVLGSYENKVKEALQGKIAEFKKYL